MPTIPQLPVATTANADDELPLQQNGATTSVTVATLLASTQPAITVPTGALLGRASLGAGTPETIAIGNGLTLASATLAANIGSTAGTVAAGNDARLTGALQSANNLADLANPAAARGNLGLGSLAVQNAGAVAISGGAISATDLSGATALAAATSTARTLAARFADRINVNDFGLARDGVTDDSVKFAAAVAAASAANKALYIPAGGPILLAGAAQVILQNVALIGDGGTDFGYPYGHAGSQIWITATAQSPFLIGPAVLIERLCFYYPNQIDQPGGPLVYPPLLLGNAALPAVADFVFRDNQVTNAYDFLAMPAGTTMGDVFITGNRICALNVCFAIPNAADILFIADNFFSYGVFEDEVLHYSGGGTGAITTTSLTLSAGAAIGATVLAVTSLEGVVVGMPISGNAAIPFGATIAELGSNTITLSAPLLAPLASGATCNAIQNSYYLRDYVTTNGVWLQVSGNGSPTAAASMTNGGPIAVGNFVFGYRIAILVDGGTLAGNFVATSFDSVGTVLKVTESGTLLTTSLRNFTVYGYVADDFGDPAPLFEIANPAPNTGISTAGPDLMLSVSGMEVGFAQGAVFDIKGDAVYEIHITDSKLTRYSHGGVIGPFPALRIDAPAARLTLAGCDILPNDGGLGVQITAIAAATITGNCFAGCAVPVDIETTTGAITLSGNTSVATSGAYAVQTALLAASSFTVGGAPKAGDVLTLTATSAALIGGQASASYTVASGDTAASIARNLCHALDAEIAFVPASVLNTAPAGATTLTLYDASALSVGMVALGNSAIAANATITAIAGNTITLSAALTAVLPFNGAITLATPLAALSAHSEAGTGVFVTVHPANGELIAYAPGSVTWEAATSAGAGTTLTLGAPATGAAGNVLDVGNGWDKSNLAFAPLITTVTPEAVNGVRVSGGVTTASVGFTSAGSDAAIALQFNTQGAAETRFAANSADLLRLVPISGFSNYLALSPGSASQAAALVSAGALPDSGVALAGAGNGAVALGTAGANGSPVALLGARAEQSYSYQTPSSGASLAVPNNCSLLQIAGSATLAALSVTLPAAPIDGQEVTIATLPAISALTLSANAGQTLAGAPASLAANSALRFVYFAAPALWARLQ